MTAIEKHPRGGPRPGWAAPERHALADTLRRLGPGEPTLCKGWLTRDLAVHLVLRERRPHLAAARHLPLLAGRRAAAVRSLRARDWPDLVALVRAGPPRWTPFGLPVLAEPLNRAELFVHHEDLRRAQPRWSAREIDPGYAAALWRDVRRLARVSYRRSARGVALVATGPLASPDGTPSTRRVVAKRGRDTVTVTGSPGELLLHCAGRREQALVEVSTEPGSPPAADWP